MRGMVSQEVEALARLDLHELREEWAKRFGSPPRFRSTDLFRLMLAWRIQALVHGGLAPDTIAMLRRKGPVEAAGRELGVGAVLRRIWKGEEIVVEVVSDGFEWRGQTFKSLSAAATAIAGSKWNGPRFFGLRP